MPADFDRCVRSGGKVRTISGPNKQFGVKGGQYMKVCFQGKKMHRGHLESNNTYKALQRGPK